MKRIFIAAAAALLSLGQTPAAFAKYGSFGARYSPLSEDYIHKNQCSLKPGLGLQALDDIIQESWKPDFNAVNPAPLKRNFNACSDRLDLQEQQKVSARQK